MMTFLTPSPSLLCLWRPSWWSSLTHQEGQSSPWPSGSPQTASIEFGALTMWERGFHVEKTTLETAGRAQTLNQSRANFFCSRWSSGASLLCHAIEHRSWESSIWRDCDNLQHDHFPAWLWLSFLSVKLKDFWVLKGYTKFIPPSPKLKLFMV